MKTSHVHMAMGTTLAMNLLSAAWAGEPNCQCPPTANCPPPHICIEVVRCPCEPPHVRWWHCHCKAPPRVGIAESVAIRSESALLRSETRFRITPANPESAAEGACNTPKPPASLPEAAPGACQEPARQRQEAAVDGGCGCPALEARVNALDRRLDRILELVQTNQKELRALQFPRPPQPPPPVPDQR